MHQPKDWDDATVMRTLEAGTAMSHARRLFSSHAARIEQEGQQRTPRGPIALRRSEFQAVYEIAQALGVAL